MVVKSKEPRQLLITSPSDDDKVANHIFVYTAVNEYWKATGVNLQVDGTHTVAKHHLAPWMAQKQIGYTLSVLASVPKFVVTFPLVFFSFSSLVHFLSTFLYHPILSIPLNLV